MRCATRAARRTRRGTGSGAEAEAVVKAHLRCARLCAVAARCRAKVFKRPFATSVWTVSLCCCCQLTWTHLIILTHSSSRCPSFSLPRCDNMSVVLIQLKDAAIPRTSTGAPRMKRSKSSQNELGGSR